ncbi:MAG: hypothetical protein ACYCOX_16040 [Acidobacteriaceae bacterium]
MNELTYQQREKVLLTLLQMRAKRTATINLDGWEDIMDAWRSEGRYLDLMEGPTPEGIPSALCGSMSEWLLARCTFRDNCTGGISGLHLDYARWCGEHFRDNPVSRRDFEHELRAQGFHVADGISYGLLLKEDYEAAFPTPAALAAHQSPAKRQGCAA